MELVSPAMGAGRVRVGLATYTLETDEIKKVADSRSDPRLAERRPQAAVHRPGPVIFIFFLEWGIGVGYIGGKLVERGARAHWMTHSFQQLSALSLALIAFLGAEQIGGNGFIAAFTAGLTLANAAKGVCGVLQEFAETEGQLLALLTFLCFGAHLIWPVIGEIDGTMILYAVLSLTVIRMVPVALSLLGSGLMPVTYGFLGWFGPRGLATILFASLVLEQEVPGGEQIYLVALTTAFLSVFLHGLTAWPGAKLYSRSCRID